MFACAGQLSDKTSEQSEDDALIELSALEAITLIKSKQITATQLVEAYLVKARQYRHLNAYITLDDNHALRQAALVDQRIVEGTSAGRLTGLPLVIKDNIEVSGMPFTIGTPSMKDIVATRHAAVVQLLVDEGAIILGKANMHELAVGVTSNNAYFGAVGNPYNPAYFAGGSSGGTAAAIASRGAMAGLGSDTGGSVRIPAALTGLYGLRPTTGRYPGTGVVPISSSRDTAGPMARTVADLILLDAVITGNEADYQAAETSSIRLGVPRGYFYAELEPGLAELTEQVLQRIAAAGITLVETDINIPPDIEGEIGFHLVSYEIREELPGYLQTLTAGQVDFPELISGIASPDVKEIFETLFVGDNSTSAEQYREIKDVALPRFQAVYRNYFNDNQLDAMIFPTTPLTAKPVQDNNETPGSSGSDISTFKTLSRNTAPGSVAGLPGITLPIGLIPENGLPVGIAIDGPANSDKRLLSIALALEKIFKPMPPPGT